MSECLLDVSDFVALRAGRRVNAPVQFQVRKGEIAVLRGENGAGKSTLLQCVLEGRPHLGRLTMEVRRVAYAPQGSEFLRSLTIGDAAWLVDVPADTITRFGEAVAFSPARRLRDLSGGELQQVKLQLAFQRHAGFVVLDEPFVGLDVSACDALVGLLKQAKAEAGLLVVDHERHCGGWCDTTIDITPSV